MSELNITPFAKVYDAFFSKITDDMYMELTERETYSMLGSLLFAAIQWFEFPRVDLTKYVNKKRTVNINQMAFNSLKNLENFDSLFGFFSTCSNSSNV